VFRVKGSFPAAFSMPLSLPTLAHRKIRRYHGRRGLVPWARRPVTLMISQRLPTLMDNLAGIWIPHNFCVLVVPAVLSLLSVHPLLAVVRPTRPRHGHNQGLSPGLPASPLVAFPLTLASTSATDAISTPNLRDCEPQSGQAKRFPAGVLGGSSSCLPHAPHHIVCFTVTIPTLQTAAPKTPLSALLLAPLRVGPPSRAPSPVAHVGYCRPSR
jgi:hypothetical protein